jgi:steroid 5-alpha reductase family enzyme
MFTDILIMMLAGFLLLFLLMCILWLIQKQTKNAGIVDVLWAFSFPILTTMYVYMTQGVMTKKSILLCMVWIWGGRLGTYLFIRNQKGPEDIRYQKLREEWGDQSESKMFFFFQFQALLATVLSFPFALISYNSESGISLFEMIGIVVWMVGVGGESLADSQLKRFKKNPANKGKVCDSGLWHYSRHPNYFFEWTIWVSYFIFALSVPYGWLSIVSPLFMLYFLVKVTGIPMTEELSLKSKGEAYREYQRTTSAFVPWFKKSASR